MKESHLFMSRYTIPVLTSLLSVPIFISTAQEVFCKTYRSGLQTSLFGKAACSWGETLQMDGQRNKGESFWLFFVHDGLQWHYLISHKFYSTTINGRRFKYFICLLIKAAFLTELYDFLLINGLLINGLLTISDPRIVMEWKFEVYK